MTEKQVKKKKKKKRKRKKCREKEIYTLKQAHVIKEMHSDPSTMNKLSTRRISARAHVCVRARARARVCVCVCVCVCVVSICMTV